MSDKKTGLPEREAMIKKAYGEESMGHAQARVEKAKAGDSLGATEEYFKGGYAGLKHAVLHPVDATVGGFENAKDMLTNPVDAKADRLQLLNTPAVKSNLGKQV